MSVWTENKFPTLDANLSRLDNWVGKNRSLSGKSNHWKAKMRKPFCWTPIKAFNWGGKEFIPLYPCIAFETKNFGHIIQKQLDKMVIGKE